MKKRLLSLFFALCLLAALLPAAVLAAEPVIELDQAKLDEYLGDDFGRFTAPVIEALHKMGIPAEADGRNDITANGCKISGNAQCVYNTADGRRRLMHHGTLLFSADLFHNTAVGGDCCTDIPAVHSKP